LNNNKGFTIVEVVIAIVILSIGILGLAATAGSVTRMVGRSQQYNKAAAMASERFEIMRAQVTPTPANTAAICTGLSGGSAAYGTSTIAWTTRSVTNGWEVYITVTSPTARGVRTDTFTQLLTCQR
jgi:type IV pilus modification protein PilV